MILTGQIQSNGGKTCITIISPTTHPTWTGMEFHLGLCGERLVTVRAMTAKLWSSSLFTQELTVNVNTETSAVLCGNTLSVSEHCVYGNLAAGEMEAK